MWYQVPGAVVDPLEGHEALDGPPLEGRPRDPEHELLALSRPSVTKMAKRFVCRSMPQSKAVQFASEKLRHQNERVKGRQNFSFACTEHRPGSDACRRRGSRSASPSVEQRGVEVPGEPARELDPARLELDVAPLVVLVAQLRARVDAVGVALLGPERGLHVRRPRQPEVAVVHAARAGRDPLRAAAHAPGAPRSPPGSRASSWSCRRCRSLRPRCGRRWPSARRPGRSPRRGPRGDRRRACGSTRAPCRRRAARRAG